ncbi:uncharacterized protein PRCAT00001592001 [Priceomyces carsonii]|uniref:uncharacterized protein n=1 Tax=Priceomyces carsonii TaxID=28549 RepID=UPI002ED77708|nr:unnamed protein product [Priceomyces carsonii]
MIRRNFKQLRSIRCYATSAESFDPHEKFNLPPWPTSKRPSPFEIFDIKDEQKNLSVTDFNNLLKNNYSKFIKIYHPDISKHLTIYDNKHKVLTSDMKRDRFDQIRNAYEILKNPKRRLAYKRYESTTWDSYKPGASSFEAYRMANSHRSSHNFLKDEEFWTAGTWEDYYRMKYKRPPPTKEEFEKNKYRILAGVLVVAGLSFAIQMMLVIERSNEYVRQTNLHNLKSMQDLQQTYDNYGEGTSRFERLKRFLTFRRSYFMDKGDEKMEQLKKEDQAMLTKYAQDQLKKFN